MEKLNGLQKLGCFSVLTEGGEDEHQVLDDVRVSLLEGLNKCDKLLAFGVLAELHQTVRLGRVEEWVLCGLLEFLIAKLEALSELVGVQHVGDLLDLLGFLERSCMLFCLSLFTTLLFLSFLKVGICCFDHIYGGMSLL